MTDFEDHLSASAELVNSELEWLIPSEGRGPRELREAMRWSLFAGGKRLRPALVLAVGRNFGASDRELLRTAAAVEMLHTYSLIHDDLPAMDNDDLRRGRETCHKKFGDATAILAGDALQALAFQAIAEDEHIDQTKRIELISGLGKAAASMVVGQQLDLGSEGRSISPEQLEEIHRNKTGALIEFSVLSGALIAGCNESDLSAVSDFGRQIGLLFQIVDDLLDVTATTETLGKTAGKDAAVEKATYPHIIGMEASLAAAADARDAAKRSLEEMSVSSAVIAAIPEYLYSRSS